MAMLQKHEAGNPEVMTIPEALDIATRGGAAALGMGHQIGQLRPGYLADVVLLDTRGSHFQPLHSISASLVYNARASDVKTVIVDGKVIMRDRVLKTMDKARVIEEVKQSMARLAQRIPEKRIQVYNP
jgi:5-methylthioadenosine/S-adenosylhomocysteine deaminase